MRKETRRKRRTNVCVCVVRLLVCYLIAEEKNPRKPKEQHNAKSMERLLRDKFDRWQTQRIANTPTQHKMTSETRERENWCWNKWCGIINTKQQQKNPLNKTPRMNEERESVVEYIEIVCVEGRERDKNHKTSWQDRNKKGEERRTKQQKKTQGKTKQTPIMAVHACMPEEHKTRAVISYSTQRQWSKQQQQLRSEQHWENFSDGNASDTAHSHTHDERLHCIAMYCIVLQCIVLFRVFIREYRIAL